MKKLSILFLALLSSTCTLFAEVVSIGNLSYNLDTSNQTAEVTSTSIEFGNINLVIPRSVTYDSKTYSVTSIGGNAFLKCAHLTSIEIPNSVTIIGSGAFYSCSGLTSITIPNSVTSIEYGAFDGCTGLTSITIPSSVTSIGDRAFFGCSKLTSIAIPNSVASIGNQAFGRCTGLKSPVYNAHVFAYIPTSYTGAYTIPDGIEAIAGSAFSDCTGLTSVKISNSVTSIGNFAFDNCSGLTSVAIPNSVTSIGDGAFRNCTGLTSPVYNAHIFAFIPTSYTGAYTIPSGIKSIAGYAFYKCTGLTSVTIPNSVTSIGGYAFFRCTSLTSITIPSSVTSIGESAFDGCTGLTSITIPSSVTSIGNSAFYGCTGMPIIDNIRYADTYLIEAVDKTLSTYTIKEGTKWIGNSAFYGCTGLTSITIPSSVTSIGGVAFRDCTGLTSVIIPDNVTSIGNSAFRDCTSLTSVAIPNSIISIEYGAFSGCTDLTDIYVTCGDLDRVKQLLDNDSRVKYMPYPAYSITKVGDNGTITKTTTPTTICDEPYVTFTAQPNTGYHFTQWSDGDINNPRTVQLTQDTFFTAEFAINKYSIQAVSGNTSMGRAAGSTIAEHFENISLTATPLYGYHFSYWESDGKKHYTNPLTVSVSKEATYTAYFQPNNYKVGASCNTTQGKVSAPTTATYLETISVTASANYGYHFAQWSDGSKENPREVLIVQDTTFTAEFAKNQYSVQAISENNVKGSTSGSTVTDYMNNVEIAAIPQYGYHFAYWMSDSEKFYDNPLSVTVRSDVDYTAYFDLNTYIIDTHTNPVQGLISAPAEAKYMEQITITATANKGYHFSKWSDGDINNPRTIQLTQDTSFTAEFAKAKYAIITSVNDEEGGTVIGDAEVEYLTSVTLTATANYGYHFDHWEAGSKTYSSNPLTVTVTGSAAYKAFFARNTYSISANSNNTSWGSVTAPTQAEYMRSITLTATAANGCHFAQWNDGETDNPRKVKITQDTTFTAEFAITTSGSCGDNLTWSYRNNKLTISGSGAMYTYTATTAPWRLLVSDIYSVVIPEGLTDISSNAFNNCQNLTYVIWNAVNCTAPSDEASAPFYAIRTKIRSFTFGESVKKVPAYLCYEMSALTSITLGSNVTNIGKHAFESCEDLASITCEASIPPTCGTDAFTGVSIFIPVHVPHLSLEKYAKAPIWKEFDAFSSIQAENKPVSDVTVTPLENSVVIEWPAATGAEVYTLVIERNGVPFCILSFNAQGQLLGISFAPSRNGAHKSQTATQTATGWQFTVTSLDSGTTYDYLVTAKKADDTPVYSKSGTFTTTGVATSIDQITNDQSPITNKVIRDGQILILRGDRTYTLTGVEVK